MDKDSFTKEFVDVVNHVFASQKLKIVYHDLGFHELHIESTLWADELVQLREYIDVQYVCVSLIDGYSLCVCFVFRDH